MASCLILVVQSRVLSWFNYEGDCSCVAISCRSTHAHTTVEYYRSCTTVTTGVHKNVCGPPPHSQNVTLKCSFEFSHLHDTTLLCFAL